MNRYLNCNCMLFENFFIVKTTKLIFYTNYKQYYLGDSFTKNDYSETHWDVASNSILYYSDAKENKINICNKLTKIFTWKMGLFYYAKMRFTGKGYKIKKSKLKKSFKFYFGRSHLSYAFGGGLIFKKLSKYRLFLISNNSKRINKVKNMVISIRSINKFTKRGLRLSKHFILKRPGKKTNY